MALIKCTECGNDVSDQAKSCPKCGAKVVKPKKPLSKNVKILIGLLVVGGIINAVVNQKPTPTPAQISAEKERNARLQSIANAATALKRAMKDPESFKLDSVIQLPDGSACMAYHAKNSFSANMPGQALVEKDGNLLVLSPENEKEFAASWNKQCSVAGEEIASYLNNYILN